MTMEYIYDGMPNTVCLAYKFTGKERDAESGLDYFKYRMYASNMGRWMSPDWSAKEEPVPYAKLDNPQSLNLYGYVLNNPLSQADPDGHDPDPDPQSVMTAPPPVAAPPTAPPGGAPIEVGPLVLIPIIAYDIKGIIQMINPPPAGEPTAGKTENHGSQEPSPEPQTSTSGAGARQGGGKMTDHGQQRADEAKAGDAHRQVGDANKVTSGGRSYTDSETGNTVHVSGNRVVITNAKGERVTQFKNSKANTQERVKGGKWVPNK